MVMNPQQPSQPRGGLLGLFDKATTTNEDTGLSPFQNFAAALDPLIMKDMRIGEGIRQQGAQRVADMSRNKTIAMLRAQGRDDLADAVLNRTIGVKDAFSVMQSEKAADLAFKRQQALAAGRNKDTALMRRAVAAGLKPGSDEYKKFMLTGGNAYAPGAPVEFGTLDKGTMMVQGRDEQGNITYKVMPIPGSKAAADVEKAEQIEQKKSSTKATMTETILNEAEKARGLISKYSTGVGAYALQNLPETDARALAGHVKSLNAQATIETLTAMRQESPTGGALGNVTNSENRMLAAKAGALDPLAGADVFAAQLDDYERTLLQIVHGNEAGRAIFEQTRSARPNAPTGSGGLSQSSMDFLKQGETGQGQGKQ